MKNPTRRRAAWRTLALLLPLVLLATAACADFPLDECPLAEDGWIFCTGFEDGDFSAWDDYDGNPAPTNVLLADPGPWDVAGNHVARLRAPTIGGTADLLKVLASSHGELYVRWYQLFEPGFDFGVPGHGNAIVAGDRDLLGSTSGFRPDGTDSFGAGLEHHRQTGRMNIYTYYPGMYQDCVDPEGQCWGDHFPCMHDEGQNYCTNPDHREVPPGPPIMETGRWYCLELRLDGGTPTPSADGADGALQFWVDGVSYGPWDGLWFRSTPALELNILWLKIYFGGSHSDAGVLLDNVVVSTAPIGCRTDDVPADTQSWSGVKARYR
jgi:hypothetical protein